MNESRIIIESNVGRIIIEKRFNWIGTKIYWKNYTTNVQLRSYYLLLSHNYGGFGGKGSSMHMIRTVLGGKGAGIN